VNHVDFVNWIHKTHSLKACTNSNSKLLTSQKKQKSSGQTEDDHLSPIYGAATVEHISPRIGCAGIASCHIGNAVSAQTACRH
jgi:hypothetical protein